MDEFDVLAFQFFIVLTVGCVIGILARAWWIDRQQRKSLERRRKSITLAARRRK